MKQIIHETEIGKKINSFLNNEVVLRYIDNGSSCSINGHLGNMCKENHSNTVFYEFTPTNKSRKIFHKFVGYSTDDNEWRTFDVNYGYMPLKDIRQTCLKEQLTVEKLSEKIQRTYAQTRIKELEEDIQEAELQIERKQEKIRQIMEKENMLKD